MTIKRYNSIKDNTIVSAFKENLSLDLSSSQLLRDGLTSYEELLRVQNHQDANL